MLNFRRICTTLAIMACALASTFTLGAEMNNQQKNTLRAAILAEPALAAPLAIRNDTAIAEYCNATASPQQKAWKTSYTGIELFEAAALTDYIARSAAERQAFDLMVQVGVMDASKAKIRAAIADIFSGSANNGSRSAILNDMTRNATWAEVRLGGTEQSTSGVAAWRLNWDGIITPFEISTLLNQ
jgi:hypothetical protein